MIGTFDDHKALTTTEYGTAFIQSRVEENEMVGWMAYNDEVNMFDGWFNNSGVKKFVEQVAAAKGIKIVLRVARSKVIYDNFKYDHKIVLDRIPLLDGNVYVHVDSSIDITDEVMDLFWADLQSRM